MPITQLFGQLEKPILSAGQPLSRGQPSVNIACPDTRTKPLVKKTVSNYWPFDNTDRVLKKAQTTTKAPVEQTTLHKFVIKVYKSNSQS